MLGEVYGTCICFSTGSKRREQGKWIELIEREKPTRTSDFFRVPAKYCKGIGRASHMTGLKSI
jgi:hypothetical protein